MNAEQKRAWFAVATFAGCVVGYLVLLPSWGPWPATAVFGLFAVNIVAPLLFRPRRDGSSAGMDEREEAIDRRATALGGMASYGAFILACMGTWGVAFAWAGREQISVHVLAAITLFGGIVLYLVRSVAVLVLYGRSGEADDA